MSDADAAHFLTSYLITTGNLDFPVLPGIYYELPWEKEDGITYVPPGTQVYGDQGYVSLGISFSFMSNATSLDAIWSNITLRDFTNTTADLSPPPLNIVWNDQDFASRDAEQYLWAGDTMFNRSWLLTSTVCQPGNAYQWGFSGGMLLLFACATAFYAILAVNLHWLVYQHSRADRYAHSISVYRDILDVAGELRLQLGESAEGLSGAQLDEQVRALDGSSGGASMAIELDVRELAPSRMEESRMHQKQSREQIQAVRSSQPGSTTQQNARTRDGAKGGVATTFFQSVAGRMNFWGRIHSPQYKKAQVDKEGYVLEDVASAKHLL